MSVEGGGTTGVVRFWRFKDERYRLMGDRDPETGECFFPPRSIPSNNGHKDRPFSNNGNGIEAQEETLVDKEAGQNGKGSEVIVFSTQQLATVSKS